MMHSSVAKSKTTLTRAEIEKIVEPIIRKCLREFGDYSHKDASEEDFAAATKGTFRPDVRRVSLIVHLAQSTVGAEVGGEGLEIGSGYGYLLFPMAILLSHIRWSAVEHPDRSYFVREDYRKTIRDYQCQLAAADITHEPLPYPDSYFSVVTFSETIEHLPVEHLNFVLSEIARVLRTGGILIVSSPNQASLENRLRLLKGKSILDMPDENPFAKGIFGHIRLYTPEEVESTMSRLGLYLERCVIESNSSGYRGTSSKSLRRRLYRLYERVEGRLGVLRSLGDTWYMVFRKSLPESRNI
jgi:SAM-dependent methyltransferase